MDALCFIVLQMAHPNIVKYYKTFLEGKESNFHTIITIVCIQMHSFERALQPSMRSFTHHARRQVAHILLLRSTPGCERGGLENGHLAGHLA